MFEKHSKNIHDCMRENGPYIAELKSSIWRCWIYSTSRCAVLQCWRV